jgi:chromosome segregation ATPase
MENVHSFKMLEQGLVSEIEESKEKLASATAAKNAASEASNKAEGELVETQKTKDADQNYADEIRADCETAANEWEAKEKSAKAEMAALVKAKEILVGGVKAASLIQLKSTTHRRHVMEDDADVREMVVHRLQKLGRKLRSFAMMQMASAASSDPFVKIRGLIEDMISSLLKQAQEEATQKAFCDTELGKSKKSKEDKSMKLDKYAARLDKAETGIAELTEQVKELEADLAEIDKATAEATSIRTTEKEDNTKAMKDFKDSADAVISAIGVLKQFYEGGPELLQTNNGEMFIQTSMKSKSKMAGDGSGIIGILEVAEEDFTRLFAETEEAEKQAEDSFQALLTENKVSKATKQAELKGKATEIKSLQVALSQAKEDHSSVGEELDAVLAYIDKLKPQCESKAMSYDEKVARRNAEIDGLKEALGILEGTGIAALVQSPRAFRVNRHF